MGTTLINLQCVCHSSGIYPWLDLCLRTPIASPFPLLPPPNLYAICRSIRFFFVHSLSKHGAFHPLKPDG